MTSTEAKKTVVESNVIELNIVNSTTNLSKDYIPVEELMKELGIESDNTFTKWRKLGLKVSKIGRKTFVSKKRLAEFMGKFEV